MITLKNTFHRTSVNTKLVEGKNIVLRTTFRRWMRALCDNPNCSCDAMIVAELEDGERISITMEDHYWTSPSGHCSKTGGAEVTIGDHSNETDGMQSCETCAHWGIDECAGMSIGERFCSALGCPMGGNMGVSCDEYEI